MLEVKCVFYAKFDVLGVKKYQIFEKNCQPSIEKLIIAL